jgi:predicted DNA-binding protein (MmcQ/YjbR family)
MTAARRSALLAFCRSLPLVTEDIKWGNDLVFSIGGKMFAGFENNGKDATFGCKVPEEEFGAITSIEGIRPAPYAARFHWSA